MPRRNRGTAALLVAETQRRIAGWGDLHSLRVFSEVMLQGGMAYLKPLVDEIERASPGRRERLMADPDVAEMVDDYHALAAARAGAEFLLNAKRTPTEKDHEQI